MKWSSVYNYMKNYTVAFISRSLLLYQSRQGGIILGDISPLTGYNLHKLYMCIPGKDRLCKNLAKTLWILI